MQTFGTPGLLKLFTPPPLGGLFVRGDVLKMERMFVTLGALPHHLTQETEEKGNVLLKLMKAAFISNAYGWPANQGEYPNITQDARPGMDTGQVFNSLVMKNVTGSDMPVHIEGADPGCDMTAYFVGVPVDAGMHKPGPGTYNFAEGRYFPNRQPQMIVDVAYLLITPHDAVMPWSQERVSIPARDFVTPAFEEWRKTYEKSMWRSAQEYCTTRVC